MISLLLAEDDPNLGALLKEYLEAKGFDITLAVNGEEALNFFLGGTFSLCILDVMMPKKDGFTLAREIRLKDPEVPLIFLTAKSMKEDTLRGFELGADDYLTKPFVMEELLFRIKAILKRSTSGETKPESGIFSIGKFTLDTGTRNLSSEEGTVHLTTKETALLQLFCQNVNRVVSRSYALKLIWGDDSYFNARSMDVYITKLRKHLKGDPGVRILNLHGEGFKLVL
ncbi:MAG: response regulator transcription factor [Leadbetterella sp.]|nr:response regulator transcription factor [Leadbetterella sp.]